MARKTISVSELTDTVNTCLKDSAPDAKDIRQGMMNMLEHVLHTTGNYKGFRYLLQNECEGQPGVNYDVNERGVMVPHPDIGKRFANTDRTRVMYF